MVLLHIIFIIWIIFSLNRCNTYATNSESLSSASYFLFAIDSYIDLNLIFFLIIFAKYLHNYKKKKKRKKKYIYWIKKSEIRSHKLSVNEFKQNKKHILLYIFFLYSLYMYHYMNGCGCFFILLAKTKLLEFGNDFVWENS